jgi:2-(1,2-epoxy-1,2-dihydrophenyl)acetyl-CoA isomerase
MPTSVPEVSPFLQATLQGGVLEIAFNRPEKRNALTRDMIDGLCDLLRWAGHEPTVRATLLFGTGRAFCAGDDLAGLGPVLGVGPSDSTELDAYQPAVLSLLRSRKPSVAALNGPAHGAGMELALACDLRIGAESCNFGPVTTLFGGASFTTLLPLYVGVPRARRLLYFSRPVPSQEAFDLGLLDEVVSDEGVLTRAREVAGELAAGPTRAYGAIKQALMLGMAPQLFASLVLEDEFTRNSMQTADAREGARAYEERRPPSFSGE